MVYNEKDGVWYGTKAERLADTAIIKLDGAKVYEVDTKMTYVAYKNAWYSM